MIRGLYTSAAGMVAQQTGQGSLSLMLFEQLGGEEMVAAEPGEAPGGDPDTPAASE